MYSNFGGLHATFQEAGEVYGNVIEKFMRNVKLEFQSYGVKDGVRRELQEVARPSALPLFSLVMERKARETGYSVPSVGECR